MLTLIASVTPGQVTSAVTNSDLIVLPRVSRRKDKLSFAIMGLD